MVYGNLVENSIRDQQGARQITDPKSVRNGNKSIAVQHIANVVSMHRIWSQSQEINHEKSERHENTEKTLAKVTETSGAEVKFKSERRAEKR